MESSELYHIKQQFTLGAYKSLVDLTLPDPSSPDYTSTLIYQARAHVALSNPSAALSILPSSSENVGIKAVAALAKYVSAEKSGEETDAALEELRDLCVEIEGDEVDERDKGVVRVLAGTAFARAGEVEEALETLGVGNVENLEAVSLIVQIYLSIHRPDLAAKELNRAKHSNWAEDDILLQLIESTIALVTGKESYSDPNSFYTEQIANPSLSSTHLLVARSVTRLLRGEISGAKSDLEEAVSQGGGKDKVDEETLAALVVASGLGHSKHGEAEEYWSQLSTQYPTHPMVANLQKKSELFDESASKFEVPLLAVAATA